MKLRGVSLIIPALNEAEAIGPTLRDLPWHLLAECIVVDNGSTDATAEEAKRNGAAVIREPRRGYGRACHSGAQAANRASEVLAFIDGDGSDISSDLVRLATPVLTGEADFVIGSRISGRREPGSMLFSQIFAGKFRLLFDQVSLYPWKTSNNIRFFHQIISRHRQFLLNHFVAVFIYKSEFQYGFPCQCIVGHGNLNWLCNRDHKASFSF